MVSKASGRSLFDHSFRPYIYVLNGVYIRRLKFIYGVYEYGYGENLFIHTYIYGTNIYGTYIYGVYIHIRFGPTLVICYLMRPTCEREQLDLCARGGVVCGTCRCIFVLTCNEIVCAV